MGYLSQHENAWCKMCDDNVVEDAGYYTSRWGHEDYQRVGTAWYDNVRVVRMGGVSPEILGALQKIVVIRNEMLENGQDAQDDSELTAWDVSSGGFLRYGRKRQEKRVCRMRIMRCL
uniref:Uncharacterized protein n=1 Tax=Octactis speculum TaxID=3111310 RepID=A0A7S2MS47_9STRA|mmetsp:Transcript_9118/g.11665  ORF Transcript_9118/g.11665 Transcript_9118/m.11665 type:complete len:117 (+) Transcript_9118:595-945(+)